MDVYRGHGNLVVINEDLIMVCNDKDLNTLMVYKNAKRLDDVKLDDIPEDLQPILLKAQMASIKDISEMSQDDKDIIGYKEEV